MICAVSQVCNLIRLFFHFFLPPTWATQSISLFYESAGTQRDFQDDCMPPCHGEGHLRAMIAAFRAVSNLGLKIKIKIKKLKKTSAVFG